MDYWQIVVDKDRRFDGEFVYAVKTTGIYCRPSCPSRQAKRENVSFFGTPDEAETAGFRPCRRCQPREVHPQAEMVQQVCAFIEGHEGTPTLEEIGAAVHVSPYHVQRVFKRMMGISPRQYAENCRVSRLKSALREGESVTTALYNAGFNTSSHLYEQEKLGMTPTHYKKGGQGASIRYTIVESPLGKLLIGRTERGVCAVCLGDTEQALFAEMQAEYPKADYVRDDATLGEWVEMLLHHIEGDLPYLDLPIDVQATAFQQRVWQALQAIPYGETRSYSEVAAAIGQPTAVRAVATACASNRVAMVIPCHRVIREGGQLGGYRWGLERKEKLLAQEAALARG